MTLQHLGLVAVINNGGRYLARSIHVYGPAGVVVDPQTGTLYVSSYRGAFEIEKGSSRIAQTVRFGDIPKAIAEDPITGLVYVADQSYHGPGTVAVVRFPPSPTATG